MSPAERRATLFLLGLGETTRFGDALNRIACVAERPARDSRAGVKWANRSRAMDGDPAS